MSKANILHLISSGGLFGAEKVILTLTSQNKNNQSICAIENSHNPHTEIVDEAKNHGIRAYTAYSKGPYDPFVIFKINDIVKNNHFNVIHSHNYKSDIIAYFVSKMSKIHWIATNHNGLNDTLKVSCYEKIDYFLLRDAHKIVAVNSIIEEHLNKNGISSKKIQVITNGVDTKLFSNNFEVKIYKQEFDTKNNDIIVSIIGRLSPEKGHSIFLKAAKSILECRQNFKFLIIGEGPLKSQLQQEATELGINEKVIFTGFRKDIPNLYSFSDILVNSSFMEGFPMCVLEAMACGKPVIATKVGSLPTLIQNYENGILIDIGNSLQIAQEVLRLSDDKPLLIKIGQQAKRTILKSYTAQRMHKEYTDLYKSLFQYEKH